MTIAELAGAVAATVGFMGRIVWDRSRPDGTPRKLLDVSRLRDSGWEASIGLAQGLASTYEWFLAQESAQAQESAHAQELEDGAGVQS